jgi:hypothetical protein
MELGALANHRKAIRAELASYAERFRALQTEALGAVAAELGGEVSPEAVAFLMTALSQVLVMEDALGIETGHKEARELIVRLIDQASNAR